MEESIVFGPEIPDRELDKEVQKIDDRLARTGEIQPSVDDSRLGGGRSGGLDAVDDLDDGMQGGGMNALEGSTSSMDRTLSERLPTPVPGISASKVMPIALAGGVGLGMLSAMTSSSARLQATVGMFGTAMDLFFRPFGDWIGEIFRPMATDMIDFAAQFSDIARSDGLAVALQSVGTGIGESIGEGAAGALQTTMDLDLSDVDWSDHIDTLKWSAMVNPLSWSSWISTHAWDSFVDEMDWPDWLSPLSWDDYLDDMTWKDFIDPFNWAGVIKTLTWDGFIGTLQWTSHISALSWPMWIGELAWTTFVEDINWSDFIPNLGGGDGDGGDSGGSSGHEGRIGGVRDLGDTDGFEPDDFPGFPGTGVGLLQSGGVVTGPMNAIVGEGRQSEAVIPLDRLESMINSAANVGARSGGNQSDGDTREVASKLDEVNRNLKRLHRALADLEFKTDRETLARASSKGRNDDVFDTNSLV